MSSEEEIRLVIENLNIPMKLKGREYLIFAIEKAMEYEYELSITKDVYLEVAQKNCCSPSSIERRIAYVIQYIWNNSDLREFGFNQTKTCPTNKEFCLRFAHNIKNQSK